MALQFSTTIRNAMLNQIEGTVGTSAVLQIRSGSAPANCAAASTGTLLAEIQLDSDWATAGSSGQISVQTLTDSDLSADGTGTAAHFRLLDSTKTTCHMQGTVTATGGGGDLTIDNTSLVAGQQVDLTSWTITAPGA